MVNRKYQEANRKKQEVGDDKGSLEKCIHILTKLCGDSKLIYVCASFCCILVAPGPSAIRTSIDDIFFRRNKNWSVLVGGLGVFRKTSFAQKVSKMCNSWQKEIII